MELRKFNLNLLKAFSVLYQTQNVTEASKKMGITQAAMSNTLSRLREAFDDSLFIRTSKGILPTARAHSLS